MYFEEKMIDGVLNWRNDPEGEWTPYTVKELSLKFKEAEEALKDYTVCVAENMDLRRILEMQQKAKDLSDKYFQQYKK